MFKEPGYFEEESLDIGLKNNCKKVNVPNLTAYYINNCRQTEGKISYVDMKTVGQVNRIKNASETEIEDAREEKTDSDFSFCTFPEMNPLVLLSISVKPPFSVINLMFSLTMG